jgi:predicted nucleotidyltransferase component of viral defense system
MVNEWIENEFSPKNSDEAKEALRQVMQQIALAGLYRANFFAKAAFYGGTALRIFYGLPRFSEDLDFSLYQSEPDFSIEPYLNRVEREFKSLGIDVRINVKNKRVESDIESAFLKSETLIRDILIENVDSFFTQKEKISVKIKLEVDTLPPTGFKTENKLLLRPFSCYIPCFVPGDLMAGKLHALLFRKWKNRVKGRDWFDFEWYIKQGTPVNLSHLKVRSVQTNDWNENEVLDRNSLLKLLKHRINEVDFEQAKMDVRRFLKNPDDLNIWSDQYFLDLLPHLKVEA